MQFRKDSSAAVAASVVVGYGFGIEIKGCSPMQYGNVTSIFPTRETYVPQGFYFDPKNLISAPEQFRISRDCGPPNNIQADSGVLFRLMPTNPTERSAMFDFRPLLQDGKPWISEADRASPWLVAPIARQIPFDIQTGGFETTLTTGAFERDLWLENWSYLSEAGKLPVNEWSGNDRHILCGNLTANKELFSITYYMVCDTFVAEGVTLLVRPGAVIKAYAQDIDGIPPRLIVLPGAKILAQGNFRAPITFTSALPEKLAPSPGSWGGIIILGKGVVSGEGQTKRYPGIADNRAVYGGENNQDNSGILQYVRVWNGGGITFAGVGSGTIVENVEAAYNLHDGIGVLGGAVDFRYCSTIFNQGNGVSVDEGYIGTMQYLFCMVGNKGKYCLDVRSSGNDFPRSFPQISHATLIGGAPKNPNALINLSGGTGGTFQNLILMNALVSVQHQNCSSEARVQGNPADSEILPGTLYFSGNNILFETSISRSFKQFSLDDSCIWNPSPTSINLFPRLLRTRQDMNEITIKNGGFDFRPDPCGPAYSQVETALTSPKLTAEDWKGGFGPENWLVGLSYLSDNLYLSSDVQSDVCLIGGEIEVKGEASFFNTVCDEGGTQIAMAFRADISVYTQIDSSKITSTARCGSVIVEYSIPFPPAAMQDAQKLAQTLVDSSSSILSGETISKYGLPSISSVLEDSGVAAPSPTSPTTSCEQGKDYEEEFMGVLIGLIIVSFACFGITIALIILYVKRDKKHVKTSHEVCGPSNIGGISVGVQHEISVGVPAFPVEEHRREEAKGCEMKKNAPMGINTNNDPVSHTGYDGDKSENAGRHCDDFRINSMTRSQLHRGGDYNVTS